MSGARAGARTCAPAASVWPCRSGFVSAADSDARAHARAAARKTPASAREGRSAFESAAHSGVCSPRARAHSPLARGAARLTPARALLRRAAARLLPPEPPPAPALPLPLAALALPLAALRRRHPNQYRCRQSMEESTAECAVARSRLRRRPRVAAWTTCDQERWSAQLPPYSRLFLGLTHRKCRQEMEALRSSEKAGALEVHFRCNCTGLGPRAAQTTGAPKTSTFGSVNSSTAKRTPSRPRPESFMPPYGKLSTRSIGVSLMSTPP